MSAPKLYKSVLLVVLLFAELVLGLADPASAAQPATSSNAIPAQASTSDCQSGKGFNLNAANKTLLNLLQSAAGTGGVISCHDYTGKVRFLSTEPGKPVARAATLSAKASPEEATRNFLTTYGSLFGLTDQSKELNVMRNLTGEQGNYFVRYQQVYQGIPVISGEIIVQVGPNQQVISAGGELVPDLSLSVTPQLTADQARSQAFGKVAKTYKVDAAHLTASTPELAIYDPRLLADTGGNSNLVWKMTVESDGSVTSSEPFQEYVLVDAQTGAILLSFNQIEEAKNRRVCNKNNAPVSQEGDCTSPVRIEGQGPNAVDDVNKAYDYAGATYDFYKNNFNRDSLNGAGMILKSTVKFCYSGATCPYQNAFWNGTQMYYGQGFAVADDVVGHELTHGFTQYTSNLFYTFESGAINESMSDIFGEFIDQTDGVDGCAGSLPAENWLIGEDLPIGGACNGQLRSMKDPTIFGDPDKISSPNYYSGYSDSGGVHYNSGISNKAAYLIAAGTSGEPGGSFNGQTITALGIPKAAQIYYELETHILSSGSNYRDLYNYLPQACNNLVGTHGITSADCQQVTKAVTATEMNFTPPSAPGDAPICAAGQIITNLFFDNMENTSSGNWTEQISQGSTDPWNYSTANSSSGRISLHGADLTTTSDTNAHMNSSVALPANAYMNFRQYYEFDFDSFYNYDGGVVEYSTNGGSIWNDAGSLFDYNGYTGTLSASPLVNRNAFVGLSGGYYSSRLNLSLLVGQSVRFRFRIGTDAFVGYSGWFIDDVHIYTCTTPATTTVLTSSVNPSYSGQPVTLTAKVSSPGITPTGTVTFYDNGSPLGSAVALGVDGTATYTTSALSIATHPITATYSGDSNNNGSSSGPVNQQVIIAPTIVTLLTAASPVFSGQSLTFTAKVTNPWGGVPTGTITFYDNGSPLGSAVALGVNGTAIYTTSTLSTSNHPITAIYAGDSSNSGGTSNIVNQQILATGCTSLLVNTVNDDNSCGSLRQALAVAHSHAVTTGSIIVQISAGVSGAVKLDGATAGVTLGLGITLQREGAGCGSTGPDKFIQAGTGPTGDGLTLNKANLTGIWVSGFAGRQIVVYGGQGDNTLSCVKSTKINPA